MDQLYTHYVLFVQTIEQAHMHHEFTPNLCLEIIMKVYQGIFQEVFLFGNNLYVLTHVMSSQH